MVVGGNVFPGNVSGHFLKKKKKRELENCPPAFLAVNWKDAEGGASSDKFGLLYCVVVGPLTLGQSGATG